MATVTADSLYQLIKQFESTFPIPAPYVTVNVGTFDAATGTFQGLMTEVSTDPEPIEHGPHDQPRNPPPRFVGDLWEEITIDARWRRTIRTVPAPKVPLAPVLLQFAVKNAATPWSVTISGFTTTAPASQTTLSVSIWDRSIVQWQIRAGAGAYSDQLRIQRPGGLAGAGAFTIPVVPVGIIYAPPADSLGRSAATYGVGDTVGTTVSYDFSTDSSQTVPKMDTAFTDFNDIKNALDVVGTVLGLSGDMAGKNGIAAITSAMGTATQTEQSGTVEGSGTSLTVIDASTENISTNTKGGGPGVGDVIVFYKNMRVAWAYANGQLRLCPLGHTKVPVTAAFLQNNLSTVGISSADQQHLLSLDPFVAGGPGASLPPDRFTVPDGGEVNLEYGGGLNIDQKFVVTRDTKTTTTQKTYTTDTSSWDPGAFLKLLGIGGDKTQVTTTETNATASDVSTTTTLEANLFAGPNDYFVVTIWYDQLFGTWAFQQGQAGSSAILSGSGARPGDVIRLKIGNRAYVTVADARGAYGFRAKSIPQGAASLTVGGRPPTTVNIGGRPETTRGGVGDAPGAAR
jgi:hypothetical protein